MAASWHVQYKHLPCNNNSQCWQSAREDIYLPYCSRVWEGPRTGQDQGVGCRISSPWPTYTTSKDGGVELGAPWCTDTCAPPGRPAIAVGRMPSPKERAFRAARSRTTSRRPEGIEEKSDRASLGASLHKLDAWPISDWRWASCKPQSEDSHHFCEPLADLLPLPFQRLLPWPLFFFLLTDPQVAPLAAWRTCRPYNGCVSRVRFREPTERGPLRTGPFRRMHFHTASRPEAQGGRPEWRVRQSGREH